VGVSLSFNCACLRDVVLEYLGKQSILTSSIDLTLFARLLLSVKESYCLIVPLSPEHVNLSYINLPALSDSISSLSYLYHLTNNSNQSHPYQANSARATPAKPLTKLNHVPSQQSGTSLWLPPWLNRPVVPMHPGGYRHVCRRRRAV